MSEGFKDASIYSSSGAGASARQSVKSDAHAMNRHARMGGGQASSDSLRDFSDDASSLRSHRNMPTIELARLGTRKENSGQFLLPGGLLRAPAESAHT